MILRADAGWVVIAVGARSYTRLGAAPVFVGARAEGDVFDLGSAPIAVSARSYTQLCTSTEGNFLKCAGAVVGQDL